MILVKVKVGRVKKKFFLKSEDDFYLKALYESFTGIPEKVLRETIEKMLRSNEDFSRIEVDGVVYEIDITRKDHHEGSYDLDENKRKIPEEIQDYFKEQIIRKLTMGNITVQDADF